MTSVRNTAPASSAAVVIRHRSAWDQDRHAPAFLRPIVDGVLRRLASSAKNPPAPADKAGR